MSLSIAEVQQSDLGLPGGWTRTKFGEIYELVYGKGLTKAARNTDGPYPVYGSSGIVGYHDAFLVEGPAIIVGRKGAAGAVTFSRGPCWPIDTTYYVRDCEHIDLRYSFYFLTSLRLGQFDRSTAIPGLNRDDAYDLVIHLPPLAEQHRIVAKIEELFSELDKGVENLEKAREQLNIYRQAILKHAFEGKLTAQWRARNRDKLESPDVLVARIRKEREARYEAALQGWERAVAAWKKGGQKGRKPAKPKQFEEFDLLCSSDRLPWPDARVESLLDAPLINGRSVKDKAGGFPVLRLTALKNGSIDFREFKEGDWSQDDAEPCVVERDDIFIARGNGSKKLVGIASLVLDDPLPVAFPDTMIRAQVDTSAVRPEYFVLAWNSWTVRRQIEKAARTTAGIYKINQGHVRGFVLPLASLAEQAEVIRLLDGCLRDSEALEMEVDASIARAQTFRQSILKKAFSGQLVAQDPNDEPALALIERIKAEKLAQSQSAKLCNKRRRVRVTA